MTLGRWPFPAALAAVFVAAVATVSCTEIPTSGTAVLSIAFDSLPAPSVVLGDTLRDSTGRAAAARATVYNFTGSVIADAPVRFQAVDRGVTIDSITGFAIGDSLRQTPARIAVSVGNLQAFQSLDISLRPDTVAAVNARDSLLYSLLDSTKNFSSGLAVSVLHSLTSADSAVKSWVVSFAVASPADTLLGVLVNDAGKSSRVDTTDASGIASRKIFLNPVRLTALTDSVIVQATVKYRGAQIRGSPVRIVLKVKPGTP
jgi:hypothetical protein